MEKLAELEHEQWLSWVNAILWEERITMKRYNRWQKLRKPYSKLTEKQKEQDREWARKVLEVVNDRRDNQ